MAHRVYVRMIVEIDEEGKVSPVRVFWTDGRVFDVECLLNVGFAVQTRTGGQGTRYTCRIRGRRAQLFEDGGRWFVETRDLSRA